MFRDARLPVPSVAIVAGIAISLFLAASALTSDIALGAHSAELIPPKKIRHGHTVVFKPRRVDADRLGRVTLVHRGKKKGLSPRVVRRAINRKGAVVANVPRRWVPGADHRKHRSIQRKRRRIARRIQLRLTLRKRPVNAHPTANPPTASDGLRVGIVTNAQGWGMNSQVVLNETEATGAKWLREEFDWSTIEPKNNSWQWGRYDHLLVEAASRGMHVLPLLMDTPSWAGSAWNDIPSDPSEFAQFAAKVAERYGPGGVFWQAHPEIASYAPAYYEIWNEPFLSYFSAGGVNPARYARLVKAASSAGKAANPNVSYLIAGEQTPGGDPRHTFIDRMYDAVPNLNSYFDAVAAHPYSGSSAPDEQHDGWGFPRLADIHQKFIDHGAGDKPLWITEIGWSTCPNDPTYCTSEKNQAAYLSQMFNLLTTKYSSYVEAAFVYHRTDLNSNPSDKEGWFGLERLDGSHKPAFSVFRDAARSGAG